MALGVAIISGQHITIRYISIAAASVIILC